ncbi:MAG: AAA family ATPase [Bacteroidia bacterium]|nr:AAA family ATPase [Bacteroidia bacterium]
MIARETYFNLLSSYIDKPFIKIITGLRRSGKSVLLNLLSNELINRGIDETNILLINFESFEFSEIDDAGKLYQYIKSKINNNRRYYILLDEIQEVSSWEKAINSFQVDFDADIYITGSNSPLLAIKDNHPKYVVTMDENWHDNIEGIQHKHIADFILMKEY